MKAFIKSSEETLETLREELLGGVLNRPEILIGSQ